MTASSTSRPSFCIKFGASNNCVEATYRAKSGYMATDVVRLPPPPEQGGRKAWEKHGDDMKAVSRIICQVAGIKARPGGRPKASLQGKRSGEVVHGSV